MDSLTTHLTGPLRHLAGGLLLSVSGLLLSGCGSPVRGLIYQDITLPHSIDMHKSALRSPSQGRASSYRLQEPFTGVSISVEWNSIGLGDAMTRGNLEQASIMDLRQESVVLGIWQRNTLLVLGTPTTEQSLP